MHSFHYLGGSRQGELSLMLLGQVTISWNSPCRCTDRRGKYVEHMGKYHFSSLSFPVPLQAVSSFALRNNVSINVCGVDDGNEVIYPLRVSSTLVSDRHVDLLLFERDGVQHYATIRNVTRLVGRQLNNHGPAVH